jgi:hypothetical protein
MQIYQGKAKKRRLIIRLILNILKRIFAQLAANIAKKTIYLFENVKISLFILGFLKRYGIIFYSRQNQCIIC